MLRIVVAATLLSTLTTASCADRLSEATGDLPEPIRRGILADRGEFLKAAAEALARPDLVVLVDKQHGLAADYVPDDLVPLTGVRVSRAGLQLRQEAANALREMAAAAAADGVTLVASSAYRSFDHQRSVYERHVDQMGREAADRVSARPGHSQHQLGTAVDFGTIDDRFTGTPAELWLRRRAFEFGFSLSYPEDREELTGYRHESWHYRYIGRAAASMERRYFDGVQQHLLSVLFRLSKPGG